VCLDLCHRTTYNLSDPDILLISRVAALFLLANYLQLVAFQLVTHRHLFEGPAHDDDDSDDDDDDFQVSARTQARSGSLRNPTR
jgi:Ca2+/H+ antiporter